VTMQLRTRESKFVLLLVCSCHHLTLLLLFLLLSSFKSLLLFRRELWHEEPDHNYRPQLLCIRLGPVFVLVEVFPRLSV